jgi:hypothetical protein
VSLYGQSFRIHGIIKGEKDSSALAFANVGIKGYGGITDSEGKFDFQPGTTGRSDTICFSYLGYERKCFPVKYFSGEQISVVYLKPSPIDLKEVPIEALTAKSLVKEAIKKIPDNYPGRPFLLYGFFRQYHKENGKYVRLIEAGASLSDNGYASGNIQELIRIEKIRRSNNYEQNKEQHSDHFVDLLLENPVRHSPGTVLNIRSIDLYSFHYDTSFVPENPFIQCILFIARKPEAKLEKGRLYIDSRSKAIVEVEIETKANPHAREAGYSNPPYEWKFIDGMYRIRFRNENGKWYPEIIVKSYRHALINSAFKTQDFLVEEFFEWHTQHPGRADSTLNVKFEKMSSLYSRPYEYDPGY